MSTRRRVELVAWDPAVERSEVLVRTSASVLGAVFVAAVALALVGMAQTPLGWVLVSVAAVVGTAPAVAHFGRGRRQTRLPVGDLPVSAAVLVVEASTQARRLATMAAASPDGPLAEHFTHLASTADRYVVALHTIVSQHHASGRAFQSGGGSWAPVPGGPDLRNWLVDDELGHDISRLVAQLTELADAADELRHAQRQHLESSPIDDLTEHTRHLTEVLSTTTHDRGFTA